MELLADLTEENVWNLSEEDVFSIMETIQTHVKKEERPKYTKIIGQAFDFRSISPRRRDLKLDLTKFGYKFFQSDYNKSYLTGICKRRKV